MKPVHRPRTLLYTSLRGISLLKLILYPQELFSCSELLIYLSCIVSCLPHHEEFKYAFYAAGFVATFFFFLYLLFDSSFFPVLILMYTSYHEQ